jgi:serine/threonine protein kinase
MLFVEKRFLLNVDQSDFKNMTYFANGSNCEVYIAAYERQQVIVKMLKKDAQNPHLARKEINRERDILARLTHPNVVRILGAGGKPQKFIVLECLSGGTLKQLLHTQREPSTFSILQFSSVYFNHKTKSVLSLDRCLRMARDIAYALKYLHEDFSKDLTIIHRGLLLYILYNILF